VAVPFVFATLYYSYLYVLCKLNDDGDDDDDLFTDSIAQIDAIKLRFPRYVQGCSGAGTRRNAAPANILEPERRSAKCCWSQAER